MNVRSSLAAVLGFALLFLPACAFLFGPGPYGNSARKEPLKDEAWVFARALHGAVSPEEPLHEGEFVGWFGVIVETETGDNGVTRIVVDHRYADDVNIRYGFPDWESIHTVSLFGGGLFETATTYAAAPTEWVPGDLLRVYGTVTQDEDGGWRVNPIYLRHWPRWTYEVAPLRPVWKPDGSIARKEDGMWPDLRWDHSVDTKESPVDDGIRSKLVETFPNSDPVRRIHIAFTLGELGGEAAVSVLQKALAEESDQERQMVYWRCLRRARRLIGPRWKPDAGSPYWQRASGDEAEESTASSSPDGVTLGAAIPDEGLGP